MSLSLSLGTPVLSFLIIYSVVIAIYLSCFCIHRLKFGENLILLSSYQMILIQGLFFSRYRRFHFLIVQSFKELLIVILLIYYYYYYLFIYLIYNFITKQLLWSQLKVSSILVNRHNFLLFLHFFLIFFLPHLLKKIHQNQSNRNASDQPHKNHSKDQNQQTILRSLIVITL